MGITILNMNSTYIIANAIVKTALIEEPAFAIEITAAKMHRAVTSSAAAQVRARLPIGVSVIFLSFKILATTGNAVMLIAMPMNKLNGKKSAFAGAYSVNKK